MGIEFLEDIFGSSSFSLVDYVVFGVALTVILLSALYHFSFSSSTVDQFLVGNRFMTSTPVAISTAMLYISALAIIDSPAEIYYYGIESFMRTIITVGVVPISTFLFVPMFHNMELTSVFQYIGHRFDSRAPRFLTSLAFILQQLFITCIILLAVSSAISNYFQVPILTSIIGIGAFTAFTTTLGGFEANVWTQIFQYICTVLFLLTLTIVTGVKSGGFSHAFQLAEANDRLRIFNFKINPFVGTNFYNFLIGYGFMILMEMVTYQPLVQRYSSLSTKKDALKSLLLSIPLYIIPSLLILFIGIFLQANYAGCDPLSIGQIRKPQDIVPYFVKKNLSHLPGFIGFFTACIVGGGISVCCTSITSITACSYQDFVNKLGCSKSKQNSRKNTNVKTSNVICCRALSIIYTTLCTGLVYGLVKLGYSETLLPFSIHSNLITFNSTLYGPLAGVFLMALFLPCVNKYGATVGFLGGVASMAYLVIMILTEEHGNEPVAPLPAIHDGDCPDSKGLNMTFLSFLHKHPLLKVPGEPSSEQLTSITDIFSLSYLLLTLVGAIITIIISLVVSTITGGLCFCAGRKVSAPMLHPLLRFSDCCIDSGERKLQHAISQRYVDRISSVHNLGREGGLSLNRRNNSPATYTPNTATTSSSYYRYSSVPSSPYSSK